MKTLIFTDLDGTFLNHKDYSFDDSKEALLKISKEKIPLIFTTSKTKVEVELLQKKVGINEPFIIENGAAIFIPKKYQGLDFSFLKEFDAYYVLQLGLSYENILDFYKKYKKEFGMFGFSDMTLPELVKYTGLSIDDAKLSKQRDFTEPFLLKDDSSLKQLQTLAHKYNIKITKGGRFYHLIGVFQDKGEAIKKTKMIFKKVFNKRINSIALGDGENDITMLENVNTAIIIKNYEDEYLDCNIKNIQKSTYQGSKGWNEMVLKNV